MVAGAVNYLTCTVDDDNFLIELRFLLGNDLYDSVGIYKNGRDQFRGFVISDGDFADGLTFVIAGGSACRCDELIGVISCGGPTVIHRIFFGAQGVGEFESISCGIRVAVGNGGAF